jgi:4-oxalocrotonate tautomerase
MPIIQISMLPGRSNEEKQAVLKAIHEAVVTTLGVPDEAVRAWITDMDPHAFIRNGEIVADVMARSS